MSHRQTFPISARREFDGKVARGAASLPSGKPNHLKCDDRTAAALLRARFPVGHANCANFP